MADGGNEEKAEKAAKAWLLLIDEGKYEESWETASVYFRNSITKEKWVKMLTTVRMPLGRLVFRRLDTITYKSYLPGAPDGEYMIVQFKTSFENKKSAIETITTMLDRDGNWRVAGYYIR
ncbi:MAG: DUF4019 domain-containing protein [Nitrospirae bacterium]|nr:DUF4019 domain-containing protein [Nitrospirota bacterium]